VIIQGARWLRGAIFERLYFMVSDNPAHSAFKHEAYKKHLRGLMGKPHVSDQALAEHLDWLYREDARIGSGSTAAAVREEIVTQEPIGGKSHSQKARDSVAFLERWLRVNSSASINDRAAAENVMRDLKDALDGE
jgi:hypothetical protein